MDIAFVIAKRNIFASSNVFKVEGLHLKVRGRKDGAIWQRTKQKSSVSSCLKEKLIKLRNWQKGRIIFVENVAEQLLMSRICANHWKYRYLREENRFGN